MYYQINVSLNGAHFFATAERSILTERKCDELFWLFTEKFPIEQGYRISVTRYETVGYPVAY